MNRDGERKIYQRRGLIAVVGPLDATQRSMIRDCYDHVMFVEHVKDLPEDTLEFIVALAVPPLELTPEVLVSLPELSWIHIWSAGADEAMSVELQASRAVLTCAKGNGAVPLAEHAVLLILMLDRNMPRWISAQIEHRWEHYTHGELNGKTCVIIGTGHSGVDLANKLKAFHMKVIGVRRHPKRIPIFDEILGLDQLTEALGRADYVVVTAPYTPETAGLIGRDELQAMKPTAYVVVVSRGGIIEDLALQDALTRGVIAGAALDAHLVEPLPEDSPYWQLKNTIITPHNGATTAMTWARGVDIFVDNLYRFARGSNLRNVVDKALGY